MSLRQPVSLALFAAALLGAASPLAWAKSSDRNQETVIDAGRQEGSFEGNGKTLLSGGVSISQGTLDIRSATGEVYMRDGEINRVVFEGKQATLKQQLDDGTWMDAKADRIEYDLVSETITLTGNYSVKSERGTNSGQRMVYNTKTGNMQSGGDGSRVRTVIKPKSAQGSN